MYILRALQGGMVFRLMVMNHPTNAEDAGLILESGRPQGGGDGNPLQYSCPENPMDRWTEEPGRLQSLGSQRVRHN